MACELRAQQFGRPAVTSEAPSLPGSSAACASAAGIVPDGAPWLRGARMARLPSDAGERSPAAPGRVVPNAPAAPIGGPQQSELQAGATAAAWYPDRAATSADPLQQRVEQLEQDLKKIQDADKKKKDEDHSKPTAKLTAQLQADTYSFSQDAASKASVGDIENGSAFRRARVGWFGDHEQTEYRLEFDFAQSGRPTFLDVYAGLIDLPLLNVLRVGHFFEPFCLERLTSNRYVTFMERSLPDSTFAPARNLGVGAMKYTSDERLVLAGGIFHSTSNVWGDEQTDSSDGAITGRIAWLPYYDEPSGGRYYIHLGMAGSMRSANSGTVQFATQPEARLGATVPNVPFFVNTGAFPAHGYELLGLEAAWVHGPLSLQSEYIHTPVDRIGGANPTFFSWYATVSYFLTGEHRPYRKKVGVFDRVIPFENFFRVRGDTKTQTGRGAWEVAARLSRSDLNDRGIQGGRLTDLTVGLNWYLTPYLRFTSNWVHAFLDDPTVGGSQTDIFAMRLGYEF